MHMKSLMKSSITGFLRTGMPRLFVSKLFKFKPKVLPFPQLLDEIRAPWFGDKDHVCFGCSTTNPKSLKIRFYNTATGVGCLWDAVSGFESYPNIIHGGISMTILDELLGFTAMKETGFFCVTLEASTKWFQSLPLGEKVTGTARTISKYKQFLRVEGCLYNSAGKIIQTMTGLYYVPHFKQFKKILGNTQPSQTVLECIFGYTNKQT